MWWMWLLIALGIYIPGFLISGAVFSYTFQTRFERDDYVWAMFVWPLFDPCYLVYKATLKYIEFLEHNRARRLAKNIPKNVMPLTPRQVTIENERWEQ